MVTGTCYVVAGQLKATQPIRREIVSYWSKEQTWRGYCGMSLNDPESSSRSVLYRSSASVRHVRSYR
jgi:hypothetical protein